MIKRKQRNNQQLNRQPFWQADKPYMKRQDITDSRFRTLGYSMAFSAGAINAGGFFAVSSYTSHVTGTLSRVSDAILHGEWVMAFTAIMSVVMFVLGAAHASWIILWAKRRRFRASYALSMWAEAFYLLFFGFFGYALSEWGWLMVSPTILFLCFIMGMHNTTMAVLSGSAIRSTHMTGSATDLGIELGKVLYYSRVHHPKIPDVEVNYPRIKLFVGLMSSFMLGGMVGVWGYNSIGYHFTLPVSTILFVFGAGSVGYDIRLRNKLRLWRQENRFNKKI